MFERDENNLLHVVALSGGKDSTALALRLAEVAPKPYAYVCTLTGDELPEMIDHWIKLGELLGSKIFPVTSGHSLDSLIEKWNALPNNRMRWCTRVLKLEPYYGWLDKMKPCVSYVGLRADETMRTGMQFPETDGVSLRFPLQEWGWNEADVWAYLDKRDVKIPARTDCARCVAIPQSEKINALTDRCHDLAGRVCLARHQHRRGDGGRSECHRGRCFNVKQLAA